MIRLSDVPELAIVRVLTSGGPFVAGDRVSVAFADPTIGRLVSHDRGEVSSSPESPAPLFPETISVAVVHGAGPYAPDDVLTLSFIDPTLGRIHSGVRAECKRVDNAQATVAEPPAPPALLPGPPARQLHATASPVAEAPNEIATKRGIYVSLLWTRERAHRFVQVADKLFTVDRLGWYRHAFAMRLLVPDDVSCGNAESDEEAAGYLRSLRGATFDTLGRPLIAAFMPTFTVTPDWLDTLDNPDAVKALVGLRRALAECDSHRSQALPPPNDPRRTYGYLAAEDLTAGPASSVETLLPKFIANISEFDDVTERLSTYRKALIDLFDGTAQSVETVRLGQMAQPNHTLDDRLWQLIGTVSERFGGLAVA
jgi:hypothetical protein